MKDVDALLRLAVQERLLPAKSVEKLRKLIERRGGTVEFAKQLLTDFHQVSPRRVEELAKRAASLPPPAPQPQGKRLEPRKSAGSGRLLGKRSAKKASPRPAPPRPEPLEPCGESVLLTYHLPDPSKPQLQAYADVTQTSLYEARLRLVEPLPRILRVGPTAHIAEAAQRLESAGIRCMYADAKKLLSGLKTYLVRKIERTGSTYRLTGHVYEPRIGDRVVPLGEEELTLGEAPMLLVSGRYDAHLKAQLSTTEGTLRGEAHEMVAFAHLYPQGREIPYEFIEANIGDWSFLGEKMGYSGKANFRAFLNELKSAGRVDFDDSLLKHAGRIKNATAYSQGGALAVNESTNMRGAEVLSHVQFIEWSRSLEG